MGFYLFKAKNSQKVTNLIFLFSFFYNKHQDNRKQKLLIIKEILIKV